jgi:hypothetical protein
MPFLLEVAMEITVSARITVADEEHCSPACRYLTIAPDYTCRMFAGKKIKKDAAGYVRCAACMAAECVR